MLTILAASESPLAFLADFGIKWELLASQGLSFAIVATALYYFVFRPVIRAADARRTEIEKGLDDAKRAAAELAEAQKKADEKLARAAAESADVLRQAREEAKKAIESAVETARKEAELTRAKAETEMENRRLQMRQELKQALAKLAANAAAKAVEEVLTDAQRSKLAEIAAEKLEM